MTSLILGSYCLYSRATRSRAILVCCQMQVQSIGGPSERSSRMQHSAAVTRAMAGCLSLQTWMMHIQAAFEKGRSNAFIQLHPFKSTDHLQIAGSYGRAGSKKRALQLLYELQLCYHPSRYIMNISRKEARLRCSFP